jgi:hypothetical protein
MKKTLIAILLAVALAVIPATGVLAATSQDVTVTATPSYISITNNSATGNNYDFGAVTISTTPNTGTGYFTITNDSTVVIDINIKCNGWSGANSWTYGSPIGADKGFLDASSTFGGAGGSSGAGNYDVEILNGTDSLLCDDLAVGNDPDWELQLNTPDSFSFGDQQTTTVTLTAS